MDFLLFRKSQADSSWIQVTTPVKCKGRLLENQSKTSTVKKRWKNAAFSLRKLFQVVFLNLSARRNIWQPMTLSHFVSELVTRVGQIWFDYDCIISRIVKMFNRVSCVFNVKNQRKKKRWSFSQQSRIGSNR